MSFWTKDEALGLPKGSVRALVFLGLTLTICLMVTHGGEVPTALWATWTGIIGFYFGQKNPEKKPPLVS